MQPRCEEVTFWNQLPGTLISTLSRTCSGPGLLLYEKHARDGVEPPLPADRGGIGRRLLFGGLQTWVIGRELQVSLLIVRMPFRNYILVPGNLRKSLNRSMYKK